MSNYNIFFVLFWVLFCFGETADSESESAEGVGSDGDMKSK